MFDLHFHSTYSDGRRSVPELAKDILARKLEYCALTDHNTIDGFHELADLLAGSGTILIPGVEISAIYHERGVHLLAYDFGVAAMENILQEQNKVVAAMKEREMQEAIQRFKQEGFEVSKDLQPNKKQPVGQTIALDVYSHPHNQELLRKRHRTLPDEREFYRLYQAPGQPCATVRSETGIVHVLEQIQGVAKDIIIAHPFVPVSLFVQPLTFKDIVDLLTQGVTGIEVYHHSTSREQIGSLEKFVRAHDLHYTGGSDFHGRKDDPPLGYFENNQPIPSFQLTNYRSPA